MTPQDRMKKTIQAQASRENSNFVVINHRGSDKKAIVEYGDFRELSKSEEKSEIKDSVSILNFETQVLMRGDQVKLDNVTYSIDFYTIVIPGIYNAYATKVVKTGAVSWK